MQPFIFLPPVLYTLFLWWFVTGLIIVVYNRSPRLKHLFFAGATLVMLLAVAGLFLSRQQTGSIGVYVALTCGILLWGWHVAGYYLGYITGPHSAEDLREALTVVKNGQNDLFFRFRHALQASLYHEVLIVGFIIFIIGLTWNAPNQWGLWIFVALWVMHSLAKINVFLGVRNFRIEFLPTHLHYLDRLLSRRPSNPLLLITVAATSVAALLLFYRGVMPGTSPADTVGFVAVGTMIALGVFEHLLLVLPIRAILWGWGIRDLPQDDHQETVTPPKQRAALQAVPEQVGEG